VLSVVRKDFETLLIAAAAQEGLGCSSYFSKE
jgi:hypothetical protein